jgi:hypothetical protein
MDPGTVALFNGDKLWHVVTPLGKGEERIILTLQYVTNQEMGPFKKMFPNLKHAFAYFRPAPLLPWNPSKGKGEPYVWPCSLLRGSFITAPRGSA